MLSGRKRSQRLAMMAATVLTLVGGLTSCAGNGGVSTVIKPKVRFVNAVSDNTTGIKLKISRDNNTYNLTTTYTQIVPAGSDNPSSLSIDADTYDLELFDAGNNDSYAAQTQQFATNSNTILIALGLQNFGTEFLKRVQLAPASIDVAPPNGSKARLYVFHAFNRANGFETPGIDFQNPGDNPQYKVTGINYATAAPIVVDSGNSLTFEVRRTGTENIYSTTTPTLDAGGIYLVLFSGLEGASGAAAPQVRYIKLN